MRNLVNLAAQSLCYLGIFLTPTMVTIFGFGLEVKNWVSLLAYAVGLPLFFGCLLAALEHKAGDKG